MQSEIPSVGPKKQDPIEAEESEPDRSLEEETVLGTKHEVQVITPRALTRQSPKFVKTLLESSPHYYRLRTKTPFLPIMAPLKCEINPFEDLSNSSEDAKSFYNEPFTFEGDIFLSA